MTQNSENQLSGAARTFSLDGRDIHTCTRQGHGIVADPRELLDDFRPVDYPRSHNPRAPILGSHHKNLNLVLKYKRPPEETYRCLTTHAVCAPIAINYCPIIAEPPGALCATPTSDTLVTSLARHLYGSFVFARSS